MSTWLDTLTIQDLITLAVMFIAIVLGIIGLGVYVFLLGRIERRIGGEVDKWLNTRLH